MKAKLLLSALCLFACVAVATADVTVSGNGKVTYRPDMATIVVGVSSDGQSAKDAWDLNKIKVDRVFDALKKAGIDAKDMQTTNLNVSPKYDDSRPRQIVGYTVSYDLTVKVRKLDDLGGVLDALMEAGANRGMQIGFGISDPEKLQDEARVKAVEDAKKKANLYVTTAGGKLGRVLSINENGYTPHWRSYEMMAPAAKADALQVAAGELDMNVSVTVVWAIEQATAK